MATPGGSVTPESPQSKKDIESSDGSISAGGNTQGALQACPASITEQPLSKRKMKRLQRLQKMLEFKPERRKKEKEKRKEQRRLKVERGEDLGPSRKRLKQKTMGSSTCKVQVVIDCSFDELMTERDVNHLVQQLQHSYSANRRAPEPLQLYVTGVCGKMLDKLNAIGHFNNWDINVEHRDYLEVFGKENVVYLSSESSNVLETLSDDKAYIIGGLVDHNHHKGLCHSLAEEKGIAHAQLPIGQYLDLKTRKVLTVNQVFEILLWHTETGSWEEAFDKAIPKRKGLVFKSKQDANSPTLLEPNNQPQVASEKTNGSDVDNGCGESMEDDAEDSSDDVTAQQSLSTDQKEVT